MKYLHLIWAALFRSKTRTFLTLLSVVDGVPAVRDARLGARRLQFRRQRHRRQPHGRGLAPVDHADAALQPRGADPTIPGVKQSTYAAWFGGIYQDPKNFFPNFSVGPNYIDLYPEFELPAAQRKAWDADRQRRHRRRDAGEEVRLEGRRHHPVAGHDLPDQGQQRLDASSSTASSASPTRSGRARSRCCCSTGTTSTRPTTTSRDASAGTSCSWTTRVRPTACRKAIDALSANSDHETKTADRGSLQPVLRQADRRHRPDRHRDHGRGVLHPAAADRQHHGAGGARTHPGTGGAQDDRFLQPQRAVAGAGRIGAAGGARAD